MNNPLVRTAALCLSFRIRFLGKQIVDHAWDVTIPVRPKEVSEQLEAKLN